VVKAIERIVADGLEKPLQPVPEPCIGRSVAYSAGLDCCLSFNDFERCF
jgi:hypothetical protein